MHLNVVDEKGCLYVVGTPIGNLEDLAHGRQFAEVDLVAAEDTRIAQLLRHFGIDSPLSLHEHNLAQRLPGLLARLKVGRIALVSAGMPCISDPGEFVRACGKPTVKSS